MSSNPEKRDNTRFDYQAPIVLEDAKFGVLQGARMFNFSDFGLYFETDHFLAPGTDIYVGIPNSPYAPDPDNYERYHTVIKWRKPLKKSSFYYGYGVRFLETDPLEEAPTVITNRLLEVVQRNAQPGPEQIHHVIATGVTESTCPALQWSVGQPLPA